MEYINSLVTLAVGGVALIVYWLGKKNEKRNAAIIIVMDIRHAESVVVSILEKGMVDRNTKDVLTENNWGKYKHLFAADFSHDDFVAFNRFFESCAEMSDARRKIKEIFYSSLVAKAEIMQDKLLNIEYIDDASYELSRQKIIEAINLEDGVFDPGEPRDRLIRHLQLMGRLSNTVAFEKLKRKASINT